MTDAAMSPRHHSHSHSHTRAARPTTTPAARPPSHQPGSVGQAMPPLLASPRLSTPYNPLPTVKSPSPNYFGHQNEDSSFLTDSPQHAKGNWSPPSSTVRSTAAASPSVVPLDQNPDFDAFRRQSEGSKAFNLSGLGGNFRSNAPLQPAARPHVQRQPSGKTKVTQAREEAPPIPQNVHRKHLDPGFGDVERSPKRVLSPGSMILPEEIRRASPASFTRSENDGEVKNATLDSQPRFALPLDTTPASMSRAQTLPESNSSMEQLLVTPQRVVNLLESRIEQVLLLDLRVQTQYAKSHISGALSLCIPTTLLKRPSFNVQKLAEAFKDEDQKNKFQRWRSSSYIIVYDSSSAAIKDAAICINTIKKFKSEGYEGALCIVKGGFNDFSRRFPGYVEEAVDDASDSSRQGVDNEGPDAIPVMGGCPMPSTDKPANPFFGNIRQNMDLIGGVGQIPLKHPSKGTKSVEKEFPAWLRYAADDQDQGKKVAGKFEQIERREKKRMEDALMGSMSWGTGSTPKKQHPSKPGVQIAGIEKGNKNRYNNIWPFEHSRVKLQGVSSQGCDYFNASYVKAEWSNRQYISTQAPIPATFNDFWNVIWQHDIRVVVMLTAEKEGAQVKAHNYWSQKHFGPLHLEFLSEKRASIEPARIHRHRQHPGHQHRPSMQKRHSTGPQIPHTQIDSPKSPEEEPYVIVRRFTLSHERHPFEPMREITQLQYANWPDFGAPAHPAHLLGLVEQCDNVVRRTSTISRRDSEEDFERENARPVLVHCSAGCGRTGTFCTVDSVIDMLKRQRRERKSTTVPMDIDPPSRTPGKEKSEPSDFFTSQASRSLGAGTAGVECSSWLQHDDLDLVEKTVEDFRLQRISMVQSLRQYVLCYESVMEWIAEQHSLQRG